MGALLSLLPTIIKVVPGIVNAVESLLPGKGKGAEKKSAVVLIVREVLKGVELFKGEFIDEDAVAEAIGQIIDGVVALQNLTGVFKKSVA